MLQLLEDFVPRPPTGTPPLDPAGGFPSPDPMTNLFPLCPQPLWAGDATGHVCNLYKTSFHAISSTYQSRQI